LPSGVGAHEPTCHRVRNVLPRAMPLRLGLGQQVAGLGAPVPARLLAREPLLGLGLGVCCLAVLAWGLLAVLPPPPGRSRAFTPTSTPVSHPLRGTGGWWDLGWAPARPASPPAGSGLPVRGFLAPPRRGGAHRRARRPLWASPKTPCSRC